VDKYTWVDIGSSYLPSELVSAFLYAQLERAGEITTRRCRICSAYAEQLEPLERAGRLRLPHFDADSNGHMFYILLDSLATRTALITHLKAQGIYPVFHYVPLHSSPGGKKYGRACGSMAVTDDLSERLLRLPLHYEMDDADVARVCAAIRSYF
jgi:dTDP-4-amino-4,6-dideoxygalactose transaminase